VAACQPSPRFCFTKSWNQRTNERTNERTNAQMHKRTNERTNTRKLARCCNERTVNSLTSHITEAVVAALASQSALKKQRTGTNEAKPQHEATTKEPAASASRSFSERCAPLASWLSGARSEEKSEAGKVGWRGGWGGITATVG